MADRILVAYATWAGATREVAEVVGETIRQGGRAVDVRPVQEMKDLSPYCAVVLGTAIHMGKPHGDVLKFASRQRKALDGLPVALFVVCGTMKDDTPENRCTVDKYLDPIRQAAPRARVVGVGLFPGAIQPEADRPEYKRLNPLLKGMLKAMKDQAGDWRDWDAVRAWAEKLPAALLG